ncbi:serine/threonine protein kinase [Actinomadura barringtoniae]|uniref:non-specific serine/threonine protein kinase n=1 Tax=Actinomadura barringtoniae TaxID=1427535 RepID=A0A939PVD6_9ACTN|nr:serine/threonine-protein kinase [Actinomadura barringtoniae]MBO2455491.1 serine/threonine protein kinase [Actinomadura barringtoniae]
MSEWRVSGFEEVRELGRGGQGRVVLARHATRGTPVAIKYLTAGAGEAEIERLRHEARMLGQVENPHVARLYRLVEGEQGVAIIMEAVEGVSFKEILQRYGTLEPEAALTVLKGSLLGLAAAHAVGVVHRDYKPANVVVPADGRSKLIDFGIATEAGSTSAAGTPIYMAPEQWRGEAASPATDVYAATCVFYECVTGHRPFPPGDRAALMKGHLSDPVPLDEVPEPLRPLVVRGMAKEADERPASAAAFVGELEGIAQSTYGPEWETHGVRALAGTALALAALFPLAAAGLAPTAAAGAAGTASAAGSGGILTAIGTKTAVVVAGTAVVGATAGGGYGVYQATKPEPEHRPVAATTSPATPAKTLTVGKFRLAVPLAWKVTQLRDYSQGDKLTDSYRIDVAGTDCAANKRDAQNTVWGKKYDYTTNCASFAVLGDTWIHPPSTREIQSYEPIAPFHPGTDPSHVCPTDPVKYNGVRAPLPNKPQVQKLAPVGDHQAEYRQWREQCWDYGASASNQGQVYFVQRLWYLPQSKILIIDEWNTPGLDAILRKATWL